MEPFQNVNHKESAAGDHFARPMIKPINVIDIGQIVRLLSPGLAERNLFINRHASSSCLIWALTFFSDIIYSPEKTIKNLSILETHGFFICVSLKMRPLLNI